MRLMRGEFTAGKYAIIDTRKTLTEEQDEALKVLIESGVVELGRPFTEEEFFVIKLKDMFAKHALQAYAAAARDFDSEYAEDVEELARRAGPYNPWSKNPD